MNCCNYQSNKSLNTTNTWSITVSCCNEAFNIPNITTIHEFDYGFVVFYIARVIIRLGLFVQITACDLLKQSVFKVLIPMAAPGIVTTTIFAFINAWNEYTIALTLISTDTLKPLTVGINVFNGYNMIEWQYLFAASLFAVLPVVILFICIEKNLVSGLTSGGVKG